MGENFSPTALPTLPEGRFEGRVAFQQLVRDALHCAADQGWTQLLLSDANFHDWPLGERAVVESLHQWARSGRHVILLAVDFGDMVRRHARFVQWRVRWEHIITCRRADAAEPLELPSVLWSPSWVLQRHDPLRCIGTVGGDPRQRVVLRETLNEWVHSKSTVGLPASVLGL